MNAAEIRKKYLDFFKNKKHAIVPSASLIPENDPTTLFTGSGMQPMIPYLLGEPHPLGTRIADSQKSFRSVDIEEVGDNRHTTFFEMLGNWSLGDYFKEEQISWMFEFLTKELGLNPANIYVTVFRGQPKIGIPRDDEAVAIWQKEFKKAGIEAKAVDFAERDGMQEGRIFFYDEAKNWWSRSGVPENMPIGEPGGPDSEMFWDFGEELGLHEKSPWKDKPCHVNCDCGRFLEIGNNVFMEYVRTEKGFEFLKQKNVDYGGGLERQIAAKLNTPDIFMTDLFADAINVVEGIAGKKYENNKRAFRVIIDHLRAATFLLGDGAYPSNKDQGYYVRRLIRRAVRYAHELGIEENFCTRVAEAYIDQFRDPYKELENNRKQIVAELDKEESKFRKTLARGIRKLGKIMERMKSGEISALGGLFSGKEAFDLYQTDGFPVEMIAEELEKYQQDMKIDMEEFNKEKEVHQNLSRTAAEGKFKGGLADSRGKTTELHTAAHLMLAGLRKVLGDHVHQRGSNITSERLRFDFSHPEKMTAQQINEVEAYVNEAIAAAVEVVVEEVPLEKALESGAEGAFTEKYGGRVKVYSVAGYSKEICGGPHVKNTSEIKGHFKIVKEQSSSSGVRRIKAVVE